MGMVPEVVVVTDPKGWASEELLPKAKLLERWVPPKRMTHVYFRFLLSLFEISCICSLFVFFH